MEEDDSRKSARWSAVPVPCPSSLCLKLAGQRPRRGRWPMLSHIWTIFSSSSSSSSWDCASWLGFQPRGRNLGLKAGIWASRLGFGPHHWDLGLKTGLRKGGDWRRRRRRSKFPICQIRKDKNANHQLKHITREATDDLKAGRVITSQTDCYLALHPLITDVLK